LKLGVSALSIETEQGYKKAGISRYSLNVIEEMARLTPNDSLEVYVNSRFVRPDRWCDLSNLTIHTVHKYRTHRYLEGIRSAARGFDAWFIPSNDALELCPVPQVAMIHDVFPFTNPEWFTPAQVPAMRRSIGRGIRVSKLLLANSESTRQTLIKHFNISADSIVVTHLALGNLPSETSGDVQRVIANEYFLAMGTMEPRKNLGRLLEAWTRIEGEYPNVVLVMAGAKGWKFEEIEEAIERAGDRVKVLSYVADEDLPSLIGNSQFYVLASLDEGFGMPILEAMAYGSPLVLSNRGALPEVAGHLAVYFDPLSVDEIVDGLRVGFGRSSQRAALVEKGRERAESFSWKQTASLTLEAIRRLVGKS
jgi:glycosyltransferase involved in cell wall biosynthesis